MTKKYGHYPYVSKVTVLGKPRMELHLSFVDALDKAHAMADSQGMKIQIYKLIEIPKDQWISS